MSLKTRATEVEESIKSYFRDPTVPELTTESLLREEQDPFSESGRLLVCKQGFEFLFIHDEEVVDRAHKALASILPRLGAWRWMADSDLRHHKFFGDPDKACALAVSLGAPGSTKTKGVIAYFQNIYGSVNDEQSMRVIHDLLVERGGGFNIEAFLFEYARLFGTLELVANMTTDNIINRLIGERVYLFQVG